MYCKRKIADGQSQKLCEKPLDGDVCQWTTAIGFASSSDWTIQILVKIMQIEHKMLQNVIERMKEERRSRPKWQEVAAFMYNLKVHWGHWGHSSTP